MEQYIKENYYKTFSIPVIVISIVAWFIFGSTTLSPDTEGVHAPCNTFMGDAPKFLNISK